MAFSVLQVVEDSTVPRPGDISLRTIMETMGYTVTYRSDEAAESIVGMNGVIIAESVDGTTLGSKYATVPIPLVNLERAYINDMGFAADVDTADAAAQTQVTWLASSPVADGPFQVFSGTTTIFSSSTAVSYLSNPAAGVVPIAEIVGSGSTQFSCAVAYPGSPLTIGAAAAKRGWMWPKDAAIAVINSSGSNALKNMLLWAFPIPRAGDDAAFGFSGRGAGW